MFKRFLKFFRGDEETPEEPFEGSYLDHLLSQVKPQVETQLAECPSHDPLLLAVVGILRYTMINAWSPKLRCPLVDSQSPGPRPPPAPVPPDAIVNPAPEGDETSEFEVPAVLRETAELDVVELDHELGDADTSESEPQDALEEDSSEGEDRQEDSDDSDADAIVDELDAPPAPRSTRKTEEIDVEEIRAASRRAARDAAGQTMERERIELETADPTVEIDQETIFEAQPKDGRPRVDSEEVLQAGRVFLGLLIENDRLPVELQLSVGETTLARDLLLGYFVGNTDFEEKARRLLTLVEQKFGQGQFSQARILLQLFHTDEQTRINNDRNLFYEDMILRLGIRRRHRMSAEEMKRFDTLLTEASTPPGAQALCDWLGDKCLIRFQTFNRDPDQVDLWTSIVEASDRQGAHETFLKYLPPRRWRPVGHYPTLSVLDQIVRHVSVDTAREYVISQLKTCYFVLRAVGDTGLEGFLDTFFDWCREIYGFDGTVLMPELYKRSMMDPEPMDVILRDLYDEHFQERTLDMLDGWSDKDVEKAFYRALQRFDDCDLAEIAPGYYDLGSFTYDELFGVQYPYAEFPFKIHRLT